MESKQIKMVLFNLALLMMRRYFVETPALQGLSGSTYIHYNIFIKLYLLNINELGFSFEQSL